MLGTTGSVVTSARNATSCSPAMRAGFRGRHPARLPRRRTLASTCGTLSWMDGQPFPFHRRRFGAQGLLERRRPAGRCRGHPDQPALDVSSAASRAASRSNFVRAKSVVSAEAGQHSTARTEPGTRDERRHRRPHRGDQRVRDGVLRIRQHQRVSINAQVSSNQ
jgi:hypothetical protein